jgi:hypothetical protein
MTATRSAKGPTKTVLNLALVTYVGLGAISLRGAPSEATGQSQTNAVVQTKAQGFEVSTADAKNIAEEYMKRHKEYIKEHGMDGAVIWGVMDSRYRGKEYHTVVLVSTNSEYVAPKPIMYLYVDKQTGEVVPRSL